MTRPANDAFRKLLRHADRLASYQSTGCGFPLTVEVDLTYRCNLACPGCDFAHTHTGDPADDMTLATAGLVLENLLDCGVGAAVATGGGEPLLNPHAEDILSLWHDEGGLAVGLYTNGTCFPEGFRDRWADRLAWCVCGVGLPPRGRQGACRWGWRPLVGPDNWHRAPEWVGQFLDNRDRADYLQLAPRVEPGEPREWICEALRRWEGWGIADYPGVYLAERRFADYLTGVRAYTACRACHFTGMIGAGGEVWLCCNRRGMTSLGNLTREPLRTIWGRLPEAWPVDAGCRTCCRGHDLNTALEMACVAQENEAFL